MKLSAPRLYPLASAACFLAAFALLWIGGGKRSAPLVVLAALLFVAATVLLQITLGRVRAGNLVSRRRRLGVAIAVMVVGIAVAAYWATRARAGHTTGGWGLLGVCLFYLAAGQALAEARTAKRGVLAAGAVLCALCAVAFAVGLLECLDASASWLGLALGALVLAPVGLTLMSEGVLRRMHGPKPLAAVAGVLLAIGGGLLLHFGLDVTASLTGIIAGALFLLVGAIASSTQADVLVVVTVVGLVWAASAQGVERDAKLDPRPGQPALVALGDSYMSGEGAKRFFEGTNEPEVNECRRSPTAYAHLAVAPNGPAPLHHLAFYACSGAVAANLWDEPQYRGEPVDDTPDTGRTQLQQLKSLLGRRTIDVRLVIVSIGGNDAGFADIGAACIAPGTCVERGQRWLNRLRTVRQRVERAYAEIRETVGTDAPVLAVPYPQPIRPEPCDYSLLERDEHQFVNGFVHQLDGAIARAAAHAHFHYLAAMENAFVGHGRICDGAANTVGVNFVALDAANVLIRQAVNPGSWIHNSLHPNERGHEVMARVLGDWMRAHPRPPAMAPPPDEQPPREVTSVNELMSPDPVSYCGGARAEPKYCDRTDSDWTVTQVGVALGRATPALLLLVAGWWLVWLAILPRTRRFWDRVSRRIAGVPDG